MENMPHSNQLIAFFNTTNAIATDVEPRKRAMCIITKIAQFGVDRLRNNPMGKFIWFSATKYVMISPDFRRRLDGYDQLHHQPADGVPQHGGRFHLSMTWRAGSGK